MIQYLIILLIPFSIINIKGISKELLNILYLLFFFYIVFFIGFRFEMGLDWYNYYKEFNERVYLPKYSFQDHEKLLSFLNFIDLRNKEPLYILTLDISNYLNKNIIFFNLINSFIAISCIFYFASNTKNNWFAISLFTPFIIFYGMDIVRQFTAFGIILVGILKLSEKKYFISLFLFITATMFHLASIIFISLYFYYIIVNNKLRNLSIMLCAIFFIIIFFFLLEYIIMSYDNFIEYSKNLDKNYQSLGMIARFTLSLIPFLIFIFFKKIFLKSKFYCILNWFFYYHMLIIFLFFFENFSIVLDRLLVFALPFQILIYSHLINLYKKIIKDKLVFFLSSFYLIFGLSWLFFSEDNFRVYIPYKNVLFYDINNSFSALCSLPYYKCKLGEINIYE
jgi:hypothetical protein